MVLSSFSSFTTKKESGNHAAGEEHGKRTHERQKTPPRHFFLTQGPSAAYGQKQVHGCAQQRINHGVAVAGPELGIIENLGIGLCMKAYRQEGHVAPQNRGFFRKRGGYDVDHRIQHQKAEKQQNDDVQLEKNASAERFPDSIPRLGNGLNGHESYSSLTIGCCRCRYG